MKVLTIIILSALLANVLGALFHFIHTKKSESFFAHVLCAVNESTWEHLKLAFTPMLLISFIQYFILKNEYNNILESNVYAILLTIFLIPILYYPIRFLILKREITGISISIFVLSVILGYVLQYFVLNTDFVLLGETLSFIILSILFLLFFIFTFFPPKIFLFKDPITNTYGHRK